MMKSASSQSRLIVTTVIGLGVLGLLYFVLFTGDDTGTDLHDGVIDVHNAWVRATAGEAADTDMDMEGVTSAAYMEIGNHRDTDQRLTRISVAGVGTVEIHQTMVENDIAHMEHHAEGVVIPAGESIIFEPGGLHIMLMDLEAPLIEGEELVMTLHFEDESELEITAPIRSE